ncbi:MAG TPA: cell division protein FtsQ/DivIB [Solirubrobacteraceae bacterium]|nr:cell division protein FtsQ/DivIB [Solirubrobacteraceae bacterium]
MERSFAGNRPLGRLARLPLLSLRMQGRLAGVASRLPRHEGLPALDAIRDMLAAAWARKSSRFALIAVLVAVPVLGGGWLWFRHSSFVTVRNVQVSGAHGADAGAIERALEQAARHMSTLDVDHHALMAAVAPYKIVTDVRAVGVFPHDMRLTVTEHMPVAALVVGGSRTAIAADGVALGPSLATASLPTIGGSYLPLPGQIVRNFWLRGAVAILGAAPAPFAKKVERVYLSSYGLTAAMHNGLLIYFGSAARPHAKWMSFARVLADSGSAGASYVDVRLPERPAAGFPSGVAPDASEETILPAGENESTIAALAAKLGEGTTSGEPVGAEPDGEAAASTEHEASAAEGSEDSEAAGESGEAGSESGEASSEASPESSSTSSEAGGASAP